MFYRYLKQFHASSKGSGQIVWTTMGPNLPLPHIPLSWFILKQFKRVYPVGIWVWPHRRRWYIVQTIITTASAIIIVIAIIHIRKQINYAKYFIFQYHIWQGIKHKSDIHTLCYFFTPFIHFYDTYVTYCTRAIIGKQNAFHIQTIKCTVYW